MQTNLLSDSIDTTGAPGTPGVTPGVTPAEVDIAEPAVASSAKAPTEAGMPTTLHRTAPLYARRVALWSRLSSGSNALYGMERPGAPRAMRLFTPLIVVAFILAFVVYLLVLR
jgi:hypothetical protein